MSPKVSCICLTHNRTEMFKRAQRCFLSQTYMNKELVVLFENDPPTELLANTLGQYGYYELTEEQLEGSLYIEILDREVYFLEDNPRVLIRNEHGALLYKDWNWYHPEEPGESRLRNREGFEFRIEGFTENTFRIKSENLWINFKNPSVLEFTATEAESKTYSYIVNIDTTIRLIIDTQNVDDLKDIGWDKKVIRKGVSDSIVFYKVSASREITLGMKRNLAIKAAKGDYICVWDDDDWYAENRIHNQMNFLQFTGKQACALANTIFYDSGTGQVWRNLLRLVGHENTLLFKKQPGAVYDNRNTKEDTPLLLRFYNKNELAVMEDAELYIYNYHRKNTSSSDHFNTIIDTCTLELDDAVIARVRSALSNG